MNRTGAPSVGRGSVGDGGLRTPLRWLIDHRARILAAIALRCARASAAACTWPAARAPATPSGTRRWRCSRRSLRSRSAATILLERHMGVDTIALVAMVGSLALGEELAGIVVGLMFSGGRALEELASTRARRELTALVAARPEDRARCASTTAPRRSPSSRSRSGDVVVVRTGEVIPVDGTLLERRGGDRHEHAQRRAAAGDAHPGDGGAERHRQRGRPVRGARRPARPPRAPTRRSCGWSSRRRPSARRSCGWPTATPASSCPPRCCSPASPGRLSGDAVRALAVVVVATPCPLILAAPIALVSGLSRAARAGVIVKGAGAIETLGEVRTVLFDKTGTLTVGTPEVREIVHPPGRCDRRAAASGGIGRPALGARARRGAGARRRARPARRSTSPTRGARGAGSGHRGHARRPRASRSAAARSCAAPGVPRRGVACARR